MNTLNFLKDYDKSLNDLAEEIENIIYNHPNSSATKMRIFIEHLIKKIIEIENMNSYKYSGMSLYEKIESLSRRYLEDDITAKFHKIRKLGNKASHANNVNTEEALEKHKEIYNLAIWFIETLHNPNFKEPPYSKPKKKDELYDVHKMQNGSHLLYQLKRLSKSSSESVIGPEEFNDFKKYLHVDTKIKEEFDSILNKINNNNEKKLVLLCGSVGDGKSHLISYTNNYNKDLLEDFYIHNDATASFNPKETEIDTLYNLLEPYKDQNIDSSEKNILLAINLGVLNKFLDKDNNDKVEEFNRLKKFIEESQLFKENKSTQNVNSDHFEIINFTDYFPFALTKDGPKSKIMESLLSKVSKENENNPFHLAYIRDQENNELFTILNNFSLLQNEGFSNRFINLIIKVIVEEKLLLSIRDLLDLIYSIIVPPNYNMDNVIQNDKSDNSFLEKDITDKLNNNIVNLIFDYPNRSSFLRGLSKNDPFNLNKELLDKKILSLSNSKSVYKFFEENIDIDIDLLKLDYLKSLGSFKKLDSELQVLLIKTFIRLFYFFDKNSQKHFNDKYYYSFMQNLFSFYSGNKRGLKDIQKKLVNTINHWNGQVPRNENFKYMNSKFNKVKIAQKINFENYTDHIFGDRDNKINKFKLYFTLGVKNKNDKSDIAKINIDYPLYFLIRDINRGYIPNSSDKEESIKLVKFIEEVMKFGESDNEILIDNLETKRQYLFTYEEGFGEYTFKEC